MKVLHLGTPDLTSAFWKVRRVPDLVTVQNGVRVNEDQWARVKRARLVLEQSVAGSGVDAGERADSNPATVPPGRAVG